MRVLFTFFLLSFYFYQRVFCSFELFPDVNQYHLTKKFTMPKWAGKHNLKKPKLKIPNTPGALLKNFPEISTFIGDAQDLNEATKNIREGSFCRRSFDNRSGYCLQAYQCLHAIREHRLNGAKIDICLYQKNIPIICCPLETKEGGSPMVKRISARMCEEYHAAVKGTNFGQMRSFSGKLCVRSTPMIVGGETTRTGEYPHMAALGWSQPDGGTKWACGGSLISEQYVLTAAHCTGSSQKPPDIIRLGARNLSDSTDQIQDIKIMIIIQHPNYMPPMYYNDIALIKLSKPATFTKQVQPACLWQLSTLDIPRSFATGWGRVDFMGPKSDTLQKVDLKIIDQKICRGIYKTERRLPKGLADEQFCAGYMEGGKDTCQGDSGGPLHVEVPEFNCVKFIIGLTSFGKFCAAPNAPGVYTKVFSYLDWIEKIVFK